jgi:molybdopterin-guanine dinucleotide biosynthesis protein MobB
MSADDRSALRAQNFGAPVLAVCGFSGSGKTTLIEAAIAPLIARGLSVAVVKHDTHGFVVDKEGKDSDRFFRAGATVALRGPSEQFFRRGASAILTLEAILTDLARDHDLLLVEGHKDTPLAKLWLGNAQGAVPPEEVTEVLEILPWNGDRLKRFLELIDRWLPEAWRQRPLLAGLLVGGKSSRMGSPKQLLNFGDRTLSEIAAQALSDGIGEAEADSDPDGATLRSNALSQKVVILGAGSLPPALDELIRLPDAPHLAGPIAGLLAAHRWAPRATWILAACDHPWLTSAEIRSLADQRRPGAWAVLPLQPDNHPCPTLALYEPQALTVLERSLVAHGPDQVRIAELFDHLHTVISSQFTRATINVNTPDDLKAAERDISLSGTRR